MLFATDMHRMFLGLVLVPDSAVGAAVAVPLVFYNIIDRLVRVVIGGRRGGGVGKGGGREG